MSDFDAALERLLTDPSFASALAQDADRALSGYRLEQSELDLLRSQVATDDSAGLAGVATRTTKSSSFGMFSSLGDWAEFGSAGNSGTGAAAGAAAQLAGSLAADPVPAQQPMGFAPDAWGSALGEGGAGGFGDSPAGDNLDDLPAVSGFGDAPRSGLGDPGPRGAAEEQEIAPPKGYRNQVDADGDGHHDKATYRGREDGGVDILVDLNGDGRTDFVGTDLDLDNRVDSAEYDKNFDGVFEKKMFDDNGDGWLDRSVWQD